jgi:hypothetical protein
MLTYQSPDSPPKRHQPTFILLLSEKFVSFLALYELTRESLAQLPRVLVYVMQET